MELCVLAALTTAESTMAVPTQGPPSSSLQALNSGALAGVPLAARNQVVALLRDRDEKIYEHTRDIERLHAKIAMLTADLDATKRHLYTLDKVRDSTINSHV